MYARWRSPCAAAWLVALVLLAQLVECAARGASGAASGEVAAATGGEGADETQPADDTEEAGWKGLILPIIVIVGGGGAWLFHRKAQSAERENEKTEDKYGEDKYGVKKLHHDTDDQTRFTNPVHEDEDDDEEEGGVLHKSSSTRRMGPVGDDDDDDI